MSKHGPGPLTASEVLKKEGVKFDEDKPRLGLIPYEPLREIAKVLTFGAKKYDDWNWARGFSWSRLLDSTYRHLGAWSSGNEDKDAETGLSHLAHAGCNVLFLLYFELFGVGKDDRRVKHGVR